MKNSMTKNLLTAGLIALLVAGAATFGFSEESGKNTLDRDEDPVVILAKDAGSMGGSAVSSLALFSYRDGSVTPVPFQVDERAADGYFVYTDGPKADPSKGNGKYDGADELVFMALDAGDQLPAGEALPCSPAKKFEILLSNPAGGGKGWLYLAVCGEAAPRSTRDYVRNEFDGAHDWVKTDRYHFAEKRGETYFDRLALRGKDGKVGPNLIDRLKGRSAMSAAGGMLDLDTPEEGVKGSIEAWIDGPVRVVHLMRGFIQFSVVKLNIGGMSENLFYLNYYVTPIKFGTPVAPNSVLSTFTMRYTIDWLGNFEGTKYYDAVNTKGVVLDGQMSDAEKNLNYEASHDWYGLAGPRGNMVVRMVLPDQWKKAIPLKLYYMDDASKPDPPESDPGQRQAGFIMNLIDMPAGDYLYKIYYMAPDKAPPASVPDMLNILDRPVKVTVKSL